MSSFIEVQFLYWSGKNLCWGVDIVLFVNKYIPETTGLEQELAIPFKQFNDWSHRYTRL